MTSKETRVTSALLFRLKKGVPACPFRSPIFVLKTCPFLEPSFCLNKDAFCGFFFRPRFISACVYAKKPLYL